MDRWMDGERERLRGKGKEEGREGKEGKKMNKNLESKWYENFMYLTFEIQHM